MVAQTDVCDHHRLASLVSTPSAAMESIHANSSRMVIRDMCKLLANQRLRMKKVSCEGHWARLGSDIQMQGLLGNLLQHVGASRHVDGRFHVLRGRHGLRIQG